MSEIPVHMLLSALVFPHVFIFRLLYDLTAPPLIGPLTVSQTYKSPLPPPSLGAHLSTGAAPPNLTPVEQRRPKGESVNIYGRVRRRKVVLSLTCSVLKSSLSRLLGNVGAAHLIITFY